MEQATFFEHAGTAPVRTIRQFADSTGLQPARAIELVTAELDQFFRVSDGHSDLLAFLTSEALREQVEQRASWKYSTNGPFRLQCAKPNAMRYFAGFVRTWISDEMSKTLPGLHQKLPAAFRTVGLPIAPGQRAR